MARKRRRKKPPKNWWVPYVAHSDQEIERGRYLYAAVAEVAGDKICFEAMMQTRSQVMDLAQKLDPDADNERWLFYACVFYGIGTLIRERIGFYTEDDDDRHLS